MEPEYHKIARKMLDVENLDGELSQRLDCIDGLCKLADGQLWSRQVVAMVVEQWLREKQKGE